MKKKKPKQIVTATAAGLVICPFAAALIFLAIFVGTVLWLDWFGG